MLARVRPYAATGSDARRRLMASAMLETVLEDEPHLRDLLYVDRVELVTGGLNQRVTHPTSAAISRYTPHNPNLPVR